MARHAVTVYNPIAGWKAVLMWWNPDGYWEPWCTSPLAFETEAEAERDGRRWAEDEGVPFVPRGGRMPEGG